MFLNLNRCNFSDSGCEKFSGECYLEVENACSAFSSIFNYMLVNDIVSRSFADLINLKILNLGMNNITNSCLVHLRGYLTFFAPISTLTGC